jgi:hypothetical protein
MALMRVCGYFGIPSYSLEDIQHIVFYLTATFMQGWSGHLGSIFLGIGFFSAARSAT